MKMNPGTIFLEEAFSGMIDGHIYKAAEKVLERKQAAALKSERKKQRKLEKQIIRTQKRKERDADTRKKLYDAKFSEMTLQQKIWVAIRLFIYAGSPFIIYMVMPAIMIAIGTVIVTGGVSNLGERYSHTASNFYSFIGIICVLLFLFRSAKKRGTTVSEEITISVKEVNWKYIGFMALFGFCVSMTISALYTLLPDSIMASYDSYTLDPYNTYDIGLVLLSLSVLDPIAEEIVFRGYMLNRLLPQLGEKAAIWVVTIIFSLCHLSFFWIIYGIALGWILAKISIRHDNIMYSIAIHVGFNLPTVFNFLISNSSLNDVLFGNKLLIVVYAIIFGISAYGLFAYYNKAENIGIHLKPEFLNGK